jgi:hypothetical protein
MMIPRGKYLGGHVGGPPKDEAEHFVRCPACGGWIDCRDLGQVFDHFLRQLFASAAIAASRVGS